MTSNNPAELLAIQVKENFLSQSVCIATKLMLVSQFRNMFLSTPQAPRPSANHRFWMFRESPGLVVKLFSFKETQNPSTSQLVACGFHQRRAHLACKRLVAFVATKASLCLLWSIVCKGLRWLSSALQNNGQMK